MSLKGLIKYYFSKLLRIFPPLWISLFMVKYLTPLKVFEPGDFITEKSFVLNLLMINPIGHLWFLQQVVAFIIIAPLFIYIAAIIKLFFRKKSFNPKSAELVIAVFFLIISLIIHKYPKLIPTPCRAFGVAIRFSLDRFLLGISCAYLYRFVDYTYLTTGKRKDSFEKLTPVINSIGSVILILFLAACILSSNSFLKYIDPSYSSYNIGWSNPLLVCFGTYVLIFVLIFAKDATLIRLFSNKAISYIGQISFSIYIIHFFLISYFPSDNPVKTFVPVFVFSVGYAVLMDRYVETPLNKLRRR